MSFYNEEVDLVENNQHNDFNNKKLTNIDSSTVNRNPTSDDEVSNKKYIVDELDKNTILRFNQTLQNFLTEYDKIQLTDITAMKSVNTGAYLLPYWKNICNDMNNNGKITNFIKSTKSNSLTGDSGATCLPPIGSAFLYIETSSGNHGNDVFCSFKRSDIIQITNITFYYNRFSTSDNNLRGMGRFGIRLLLGDNTWSTQNTIGQNTQYSDNSNDWTLLKLDFTVENYGIKLIFDQIDTARADMCFCIITITHYVN